MGEARCDVRSTAPARISEEGLVVEDAVGGWGEGSGRGQGFVYFPECGVGTRNRRPLFHPQRSGGKNEPGVGEVV